jgi:hypothetical protein
MCFEPQLRQLGTIVGLFGFFFFTFSFLFISHTVFNKLNGQASDQSAFIFLLVQFMSQ